MVNGLINASLRVDGLIDPLRCNLGHPLLERLCLLGGDGLDDAEHTLKISEIFFLRACRRSYNKGGGQFVPTLWQVPVRGVASLKGNLLDPLLRRVSRLHLL